MVKSAEDHPLSRKLSPLRRERLNEQVVARIKDLIFSDELKVGEKLTSERDLAAKLKVSRVVVREALRALEQSGLVEIKPGLAGGAFVVYNLQKPLVECVYDLLKGGSLSIAHIAEARSAVETFAIRRASEKATSGAIKRLSRINEEMLRQEEHFASLHSEFHREIARVSANPLMILIVDALFDLLTRLRYHSPKIDDDFVRATHKRHEGIIDALRKNDADLCEALMKTDVEYTKRLRYKSETRKTKP